MTRSGIGVYPGRGGEHRPGPGIRELSLGMPSGTTVGYVLAFMADSPCSLSWSGAILASSTNGPPGDRVRDRVGARCSAAAS